VEIPDALRVRTYAHMLPVSYRGIGSANGNRTCIAPVQSSSFGSKCLTLRSVGKQRSAPRAPQNLGVAARWLRAASQRSPEMRQNKAPPPITGS